MISIKGKYYDGKISKTIEACFYADTDSKRCSVADTRGSRVASSDFSRLNISPRLARTPRYLYFPGGGKFETMDNQTVDTMMARFGRGSWTDLVYFLENRTKYILVSLAILIFFIWGGVRYGVPASARIIAHHLPIKTLEFAGSSSLDLLDKSVFKPSGLDEEVKQRILDHFQPVLESHSDLDIKIFFRKGGTIGPNAFALPNGVIIFTDEMIKTAGHDDELSAVLFHEIGHLVYRHGLQSIIQNSLLGFALLTFTGDVAGSSELFMGLPLFLTQMAYSRAFELEADRYALDGLKRAGIPPRRFADLMERIEKKMTAKNKNAGKQKKWASYLSTHPGMTERLIPFRESQIP